MSLPSNAMSSSCTLEMRLSVLSQSPFSLSLTEPVMDAFQCRIQFTRQLSNLTASAAAAKQCAQFALKNRDFDEDLFSVILETMQSVSLKTQQNP